jgi:hypothetical protein
MATSRGKRTKDRPIQDRPIQPYVDWAIETRFGYLREGEWLPLLVEFDPDALETQGGETPYDAFARLDWLDGSHALKDAVRIPKLLQELPAPLKKTKEFRFCVLLVRRASAAELFERDSWKRTIRTADLGPPMVDDF